MSDRTPQTPAERDVATRIGRYARLRAVERALRPGRAVLHMEFTPRGEHVWVSVRDEDRIDVYDTHSYQRLATLDAAKPSGIFFTARAHEIGL